MLGRLWQTERATDAAQGAVAVSINTDARALISVVVIVVGALVIRFLIVRAVERLTRHLITSSRKRHEVEGAADARAPRAPATATAPSATLTPSADCQQTRTAQRVQTLGTLLRHTTTIVVLAIAGIMALGQFGISIGPLLAGAGVAGIAIGFGAQALVRDYLTGILMITEDQYGVGDVVDVGEASGVVERVTLRLTVVRDVEGTLWYVPNGEIRRVGNKSYQWARALLDIEFAYSTDVARASTVIKQVADDLWQEERADAAIIEAPEIWGVEALGAHAVAVRLAVKTLPGQQWAVSRMLRQRIKEAFDAHGIEIPFPQQTVWFHNVERAPAQTGSSKP
ncbi:MAG: mechanosensitive ion channel family protein [Thermoleophilia bacterium]